MNRWVYWLLSVAFGLAIGLVTYRYLVANAPLALTSALLAAFGVGLTARNHLALKERYGDAYRAGPNWWNAGLGPLVIVAGVFGVSPTLPIPTDLGFALTVLLAAAILVAWNLGVGGTLWMDDADRGDDSR